MEEEEVWKDIPGYEGYYQVSSFGRVKSLPREIFNGHNLFISKEKILRPRSTPDGYALIALYMSKKRKDIKIHQLCAMAFLCHTPNKNTLVINHIDGDTRNNCIYNLEIVTHRENCTTRFKRNKHTFSSQYPGVSWSKVSQKWQVRIWDFMNDKYLGLFTSEKEASEAYNAELEKILNKRNNKDVKNNSCNIST